VIDAREGNALLATDRDFEVGLVETQGALREAQRLRYQVFCLERGILPGRAGSALETDEHDARSHHLVLRRRGDGELVGTVRFVVGSRDRPTTSFPMQRYCDPRLFRDLPLETLGEISRLALSKRRRLPGCPSDALLRLLLMRGVLNVSGGLGLTHWCAIMECSLLRLLRATGVHFAPLGPMEAYGLRQPSIAAIDTVRAMASIRAKSSHIGLCTKV
jgi:N-acyl-L-homoserine lactone synthetase